MTDKTSVGGSVATFLFVSPERLNHPQEEKQKIMSSKHDLTGFLTDRTPFVYSCSVTKGTQTFSAIAAQGGQFESCKMMNNIKGHDDRHEAFLR